VRSRRRWRRIGDWGGGGVGDVVIHLIYGTKRHPCRKLALSLVLQNALGRMIVNFTLALVTITNKRQKPDTPKIVYPFRLGVDKQYSLLML